MTITIVKTATGYAAIAISRDSVERREFFNLIHAKAWAAAKMQEFEDV